MTTDAMSHDAWAEENQRDLVAQVERIRGLLEPSLASPADGGSGQDARPGDGYAVAALTRLFGLSAFERDVVLLCAAIELDGGVGDAVARAQGDPARRLPTFGLAIARLPDAHWSALTPAAPLRSWRLVELSGTGLTDAALRLDERILHFLAGVNQLDERLRGFVERLPMPEEPSDPVAAAGRLVAAHLAQADADGAVQLVGPDPETRSVAASVAGRELDATMLGVRARDLPVAASERTELALLFRRESLLSRSVTLIDAADGNEGAGVAAFADAVGRPVIISATEPVATAAAPGPIVELAAPTATERLELWHAALGSAADSLNGVLTRIAELHLGRRAVEGVVADARAVSEPSAGISEDALLDGCRRASRPGFAGLAQRIDPRAGWSELVLPEPQLRLLRMIAAQVRHRHRVYEDWGFAARSARGLGTGVLFAGESGTGKTMAAEVLARDLRLDLYRIDLAAVVSKYIGETEKNLKQLFDAAEGSGAILLFDEADALFGKRTDVRDSHDRYANVEVSYLLQRMEAYRGLAILTTNMKQALDPAFVRRLRFIVRFPYPDARQRAAIWRCVLPEQVPTERLDYERLAQLNLAGGHIRNVALGGAFLAADRAGAVSMELLAEAARIEYGKLERSMTDAETRGWA